VVDRGVFTLPKPTTQQALARALQWMTAARERLRRMEESTQTVEQKMQEIQLLNRAKWLLIEQRGMTEPEAHRFLEKQAMDRCVSKRKIAEELLETVSLIR
jgi:response regulator NasT